MRRALFLFVFILIGGKTFSQGCPLSSLGQNPSTAFPICADETFYQANVPLCSSVDLYVPGCSGDGANYQNLNPYWYKFTCYQSGTLSFLITPNDLGDDYDWQLYDVTGLDPDEVLTNHNIIVTGNWSGSYGTTGASASGVNFIQCASDPSTSNTPRFAHSPNLIVGHNYILLISHYTASQSGYSLSFSGGSAIITDPVEPHLASANAPCDGTEIKVITNKKMKCSSLSPDGSDFRVMTAAGVSLIPVAASSLQCATGFDMDTLSVFLSAPLNPGTYSIYMKKGKDANTLLDDCDRPVPEEEHEDFTVYPLYPTPLDSLTKPGCAPKTIEIVFRKKIMCSSIDPSGTDFNISGDYPVSIIGAHGNCDQYGLTQNIIIELSAPLQVHGNFLLHLVTGPDGNTILDECGEQTLPGDIPFQIKDTVNAGFTYAVSYSCTKDIVSFAHNGANGVNSWLWTFTGGVPALSHSAHATVVYLNFEPKPVQLAVSNGTCSAIAYDTLRFDNYIKADFDVTPLVCPQSKAVFTNKSAGHIILWRWTIGNGNIITVKDPAPQIYSPLEDDDYTAMPKLVVKNIYGCADTATKPVSVVYSCFIAVPSAFTPNGDGLNDYLYPLKAYKSSNLSFSVYNRFGQRVFYSQSWQNKWDGKFRGLPQDPGTYVWLLDYISTASGKHVFQKGTTILIR